MTLSVWYGFQNLASNLKLTDNQIRDGQTKHEGVTRCLNNYYWESNSYSEDKVLAGSWGKNTRMRSPRDIDMLFVLPYDVFYRFSLRAGNQQSALIQEVKEVLRATYPNTEMRGDGQVVMVNFYTYCVEVVPAFSTSDGLFLIADTNNGGLYKITSPYAEIGRMNAANTLTQGNARHLVKMMKCWQKECNVVSLRSFQIELLAIDFLMQWPYRTTGFSFHDWMARDFFSYLISRADTSVTVPGTGEQVPLGNAWLSRAQTAYGRAAVACQHEADNFPYLAGEEWERIFGIYIRKPFDGS